MKIIHSIYLLLIVYISISINISAKVLIFTYAYNRPDFIELQYKTFKKFLKDDYEFVVFNDACQQGMYNEIKAMCEYLDIRYIRIPQKIHGKFQSALTSGYAAKRNCNVVQYSLDTIGFYHDDIVALFDSDLFLIKEFSIKEYLKGHDIAGFYRPCYDHPAHICDKQHFGHPSIEYLWIGLLFLNMKTMPNKRTFNVQNGVINCENNIKIPVDSGGYTYYYLKNNPQVNTKRINRIVLKSFMCDTCKRKKNETCIHNTIQLKNLGLSNKVIKFAQSIPIDMRPGLTHREVEFFLGETFVHYSRGTNYVNASQDFCERKTQALNNFINNILYSN